MIRSRVGWASLAAYIGCIRAEAVPEPMSCLNCAGLVKMRQPEIASLDPYPVHVSPDLGSCPGAEISAE